MPVDRYRLAAPVYDLATAVWTGGAIWRTRTLCLEGMGAGESVLIPGAGTGRLVARAAAVGARVTALEPSPAMRRRLLRRLRRAGVQAEVRDHPLDALAPDRTFDLVVAEHFLNVFRPEPMTRIRDDLIQRVRPGGRFAVADFTPMEDSDGPLRRTLKSTYHAIPLGGCALLTGNALHPIYDHGRDLQGDPRLELLRTHDARIFGVGLRAFRTWIWRRAEAR